MRYEFTFMRRLPDAVVAEFPELNRSTIDARSSTLFGQVEDTAHLHGLLARFRHLGLEIIDVHRLPD